MEKLDHKKISFGIPKAELHVHIEGTFEPELYMKLADKHKMNKYNDIEELRKKYDFTCLKDFLDLYYDCCSCLIDKEDFEMLMMDYLRRSSEQGLVYAEIFFDPQTHLTRNIDFSVIMEGLLMGMQKGEEKYGVKSQLIMCILRDQSEEEGLKVLEKAVQYQKDILGVGLDSNEVGNPPEKFKNLFAKAKDLGFRIVAHAGEEGPVEYMINSLDILKVDRIDHGIQAAKCEKLQKRLIDNQIPLTCCPLSNLKLKVHKDIKESPVFDFKNKGILAMINSDDPAYFGGYIGDNYLVMAENFSFSLQDYSDFAKNSFKATFLDQKTKDFYYQKVDDFIKKQEK